MLVARGLPTFRQRKYHFEELEVDISKSVGDIQISVKMAGYDLESIGSWLVATQ